MLMDTQTIRVLRCSCCGACECGPTKFVNCMQAAPSHREHFDQLQCLPKTEQSFPSIRTAAIQMLPRYCCLYLMQPPTQDYTETIAALSRPALTAFSLRCMSSGTIGRDSCRAFSMHRLLLPYAGTHSTRASKTS